jgi:hypothetical protein
VTSVKETVPWGKHAPLACAVDLIRGMLTISFGKIKGKVTPVHAKKIYRRSRSATSFILTFGTRYRSVVNFTHWLLYTWRKDPPVPTELETGWAPELDYAFWRREKLLPLSGIKPQIVQPVP